MWVQVFPCGCKFSPVGASFLLWVRVFQLALPRHDDKMKSRRHKDRWVQVFSCGCEFFNLHFPDTMTRWKSCRHKDRWVRVFSCGCEFFNLHFPDTMTRWKSCRHKDMWVRVFSCGCEFSNLHFPDTMKIVSPQRQVGASFLLWVRVFSCGCEFSNLHFPDTMTRWKSCRHKDIPAEKPGIENAASRRNRTVSPDGVHPTRAGNIPQILLRKLFQRAF